MIIKKMPLITIMILIKNKIKKNFIHIILNINKKDINIHKYNYFIPFIFNLLGKDISPDAEPIVIYSFNMLILSLIVLFCFINIFGYFMALYLIKRLDLINRFPKINKFIKYYENTNFILLIIEISICLLFLIIIIVLNLFIFLRFILI